MFNPAGGKHMHNLIDAIGNRQNANSSWIWFHNETYQEFVFFGQFQAPKNKIAPEIR